MKKGMELAKIASYAPKWVKRGPCQEVIKTGDQINLLDLPVLKCWPLDGDPTTVGYPMTPEQSGTAAGQGRYITFAGIYTCHPDDAGKKPGEPGLHEMLACTVRRSLIETTVPCTGTCIMMAPVTGVPGKQGS